MRILALAPRHLGDGVMALPALAGLARHGDLTIRAPSWGAALYRDIPTVSPGPADVAVIFPPSVRAAWSVRAVPRRIGVGRVDRTIRGVPRWDVAIRRALLTDRVEEATHQAETYARLAAAVGATAIGPPTWTARDDDPSVEVPGGHIGLNPACQVGIRAWGGWGELAAALSLPVVYYAGPGEDPGGSPSRVGLSIPAFGRALRRCAVFVSSDTGPAHFARACGVPTVVLHGPTAAARTGPTGAVPVEGPDPGCRPCYGKACGIGRICMSIPVSEVLAAIARASA